MGGIGDCSGKPYKKRRGRMIDYEYTKFLHSAEF
jgi:hypothetical protein